MATINDLELYLVDGQEPQPGSTRTLLVCLVAESAVSGWGEAPITWQPAELSRRRNSLLTALAGRSVFDLEELARLEALREAPLRSAIDMACWDLIGRTLRQPLHRLWGGEYRQYVPLSARLPQSPRESLGHVARELADQGWHTQMFTAASEPAEVIAMLQGLREAVGPRVRFRVDAAAGFTYEAAEELCTRTSTSGDELEFVLDPLASGDVQQTAALARLSAVPIAVSRVIRSPADVWTVTRASERLHVVLDLARLGGLSAARRAAAVAEAAGVTVSLACSTSLGVATAAMLQLAAATPCLHRASQSNCPRPDDLLEESLAASDSLARVPTAAGLGIEVDRAAIESLRSG